MNLNEETSMLCSVPLFRKINPAKLKLLAFASERLDYDPGEVICHQGDEGDSAFVILKGQAEVLVQTRPGDGMQHVTDLQPNALVGEMAVLCDRPRSATVRALTPVQALRVPREALRDLLQHNPAAMIEVIRILADRLALTTEELGRIRSACAGA